MTAWVSFPVPVSFTVVLYIEPLSVAILRHSPCARLSDKQDIRVCDRMDGSGAWECQNSDIMVELLSSNIAPVPSPRLPHPRVPSLPPSLPPGARLPADRNTCIWSQPISIPNHFIPGYLAQLSPPREITKINPLLHTSNAPCFKFAHCKALNLLDIPPTPVKYA